MHIVTLLCDDIDIQVSAVSRSAECMSNKIRNIEDLKSAFPQSFDALGNFKEEYHLTVDPAIAPVVHPCQVFHTASRGDTERTEEDGSDGGDCERDRAHRLGVKSDIHREVRRDLLLVFGPKGSQSSSQATSSQNSDTGGNNTSLQWSQVLQ